MIVFLVAIPSFIYFSNYYEWRSCEELWGEENWGDLYRYGNKIFRLAVEIDAAKYCSEK